MQTYMSIYIYIHTHVEASFRGSLTGVTGFLIGAYGLGTVPGSL